MVAAGACNDPKSLSVEALAEASAASMRELKSAHIEADITTTARATGEEEGSIEMRVTGDYQSPDRTRLSISLTFRGNDFVADYITIANETYIQVPGTDISQVSDSWDGLDLRETLRFDPDSMENLVLIGEEELDGEKVYHLKGSLASDAEGLLNSVPGSLVMVIPIGGVLVGVEFWIGVEDFLVRRTIQNIDIELSSDMGKGGELSLELDMRLSDYGKSVDIQAPDMESTSGTEASESQAVPAPATPSHVATVTPTSKATAAPPATATGPSDTSTFRFVSAEALAEAYASDPARADARYRGQDLSLTGIVESVTQPFPNAALVVLRGIGSLNVGCLPGTWAKYREYGGPVTMFGVGEGLNFSLGNAKGLVNLSHCEVVRPGEPIPTGRPSPKPTP